MAVNIKQVLPLRQAKAHRLQMPRYLKLDGGRYLIAAALFLALISLLVLGQTGRLATKGYTLARLQNQKTVLVRQRGVLQMKLTEAQSLDQVKQRTDQQQLHPWTADQVRYITVPPVAPNAQATGDKAHTEDGTQATKEATAEPTP